MGLERAGEHIPVLSDRLTTSQLPQAHIYTRKLVQFVASCFREIGKASSSFRLFLDAYVSVLGLLGQAPGPWLL